MPMPSNVFLHYLSHCNLDAELSVPQRIWLDRLPKKLGNGVEQLAASQAAASLVEAWGVHVDEGLNTQSILWLGIVLISVVLGPILGAFISLRHDVQTALTMAGVPIAIIVAALGVWLQVDKARNS
jgi:hypothetical protein